MHLDDLRCRSKRGQEAVRINKADRCCFLSSLRSASCPRFDLQRKSSRCILMICAADRSEDRKQIEARTGSSNDPLCLFELLPVLASICSANHQDASCESGGSLVS